MKRTFYVNLFDKLKMKITRKRIVSEQLLLGALCIYLMGTTYTKKIFKDPTQAFYWWSKPSITPILRIYIYNVTNADNFLDNGSKPIVDEIGPYVYEEKWERVAITPNKNGTVSYYLKKLFYFNKNLSVGTEEDEVVVPNIPLLSATSVSKYAQKNLRVAMGNILEILKLKPFVAVSVRQLLWGYQDPLLELAKDVIPKEYKLPYDKFGLLYNKNGTLIDRVSIFTGDNDITKYGLIDKFNGKSHQTHWLTDKCNSLLASDGSLFPLDITKNTTINIYDKDFCRTLPLEFEQEIKQKHNISLWRFSPPKNVFDSVEKNPDNECYCPEGPPCTPSGLFNLSLCQYDTPMLLSFPHFYLADDSLRSAVEGILPADPEKHKFYFDVQPDVGFTMSAKKRVQFNLAVSHVPDIKLVETFPDMVFPIYWLEESVDNVLDEVIKFLIEDDPPKSVTFLKGHDFHDGDNSTNPE